MEKQTKKNYKNIKKQKKFLSSKIISKLIISLVFKIFVLFLR